MSDPTEAEQRELVAKLLRYMKANHKRAETKKAIASSTDAELTEVPPKDGGL